MGVGDVVASGLIEALARLSVILAENIEDARRRQKDAERVRKCCGSI